MASVTTPASRNSVGPPAIESFSGNPLKVSMNVTALLHSVRSRHAEAAADLQDQITRASSSRMSRSPWNQAGHLGGTDAAGPTTQPTIHLNLAHQRLGRTLRLWQEWPICCGNHSSPTCRPGLSRPGGRLELPAFAATTRRGAFVGEVVRLSSGTVPLQDAADAFLDHHDLARSTRRGLPGLARQPARGPRPAHRRWRAVRPDAHHLVSRPLRHGGAGDLEPRAGHPAGRGRLVAPPRLARRRPNRWVGAAPRAGRPDPSPHPRSAGAAVCPPRPSAAGANPVATAV